MLTCGLTGSVVFDQPEDEARDRGTVTALTAVVRNAIPRNRMLNAIAGWIM
jgi:hypothetical protein